MSSLAHRVPHDPPRVIVAEDDDEMRRLLVEALRADGCQVEEAADGGRLLVELTHGARCDYEHVDLIVSDIRMPVCSGLQIVEVLRRAHCLVPIVLMTAFGDDTTREKAAALGAILLDKPFDVRHLRREVKRLLSA